MLEKNVLRSSRSFIREKKQFIMNRTGSSIILEVSISPSNFFAANCYTSTLESLTWS